MDPPALATPAARGNPSELGHRATIVAFGLVGLGATIAALLERKGIATWSSPLPSIDENGWVIIPPRPVVHEADVIAFAVALLLAAIGPSDRWRRHPIATAAAALTTGAVAFSLLVRWAWQFSEAGRTTIAFALATASAVAMLPLLLDELSAVVRERRGAHRPRLPARTSTEYVAGVGGILVGLALLFAPEAHFATRAARHMHLAGGFVAAVGVVTLAYAARQFRWINAFVGLLLLVAPLVYGYAVFGALYAIVLGLLLLLVSTVFADPAPAREARA